MSQRLAYLEALGITAWERRSVRQRSSPQATTPPPEPREAPAKLAAAEPPDASLARGPNATEKPAPLEQKRPASPKALGFELGPGQGSCLFLCSSEDDTSTPLASDLARLLEEPPVWARTALGGGGMDLATAVAERLFTRVVIFGQAQALLALGGAAPEQCGAAQVVVAPELKRLAVDADARRACWESLRSLGVGYNR